MTTNLPRLSPRIAPDPAGSCGRLPARGRSCAQGASRQYVTAHPREPSPADEPPPAFPGRAGAALRAVQAVHEVARYVQTRASVHRARRAHLALPVTPCNRLIVFVSPALAAQRVQTRTRARAK